MTDAIPKHHHHQTGVFSSLIPQIFSVIQEKLRPCPTIAARGSRAGLTSSRIAAEPTESSAEWDIASGLRGAVLVHVLHPAERQLRVVRHLRVRVAQPGEVRRPRAGVEVSQERV